MTRLVLLTEDLPLFNPVQVLNIVLFGQLVLGLGAVLHVVLDCRLEMFLVKTCKGSQAPSASRKSLKIGDRVTVKNKQTV